MRALTDRPTYMQPLRLCGLRRWWWEKVRRWPGETCQRCGRMYGADRSLNMRWIWRASNLAWDAIIGAHEGGRYCPTCFIRGANITGHVAYITIELDDFSSPADAVDGES